MKNCANCGVELDQDMNFCPLCGKNTRSEKEEGDSKANDIYPSDILLLRKKENRLHFLELSGIICFSGIAVCSIVDFVMSKTLSWSLYVTTSVLGAWFFLTLLHLAFRKYFIIIPGLLLTILGMLFFFDLIVRPITWFFVLGLPLAVSVFIFISIVVVFWRIAKFRGFNLLAFSFLILSGFCIVTEVITDKFLFGSVNIRWSAIVAVSLLPISLILLFVHYWMKNGKRLDSFFHI
jgi:hypothetical protein